MAPETLIGGLCDGLECYAAFSWCPYIYAGMFGNGKIEVYKRRADGKLHYSHTLRAPFSDDEAEPECFVARSSSPLIDLGGVTLTEW